jgi:hypothetical protein
MAKTKKQQKDYNHDLPAGGEYEKGPNPNSDAYTIKDVANSPVGGHQEQVVKED